MYKNKISILAFVLLLATSLMACSIGGSKVTEVPTSPPKATEAPTKAPTLSVATTESPTREIPTAEPVLQSRGEGLEVVNPTFYQDAYDGYHVVGLVKNNNSQPVSNVELTLEARNAEGVSLLKDTNDAIVETTTFYPKLLNIFPGESAPFDYSFDVENDTLSSINVTATNAYPCDSTRVEASVVNTDFLSSGSGEYFITGEIVNNSSSPLFLGDMAGAALDASGNVVANDWSFNNSSYLAPAGDEGGMDRTPFLISLSGPEDSDYKDFQVFLDAVEADDMVVPDLDVTLSNSYFDEYNGFHVVGTVENRDLTAHAVELVAGLYDASGVVLDTASLSMAYYVEAGKTVPFDCTYFNIVSWNDDYANRVDSYTVQMDPYWTNAAYINEVVPINTINLTETVNGNSWVFSGGVTNDSTRDLGRLNLMVAAYDGETLVAVGEASLFPQDESYAPGDTDSFEITINLPLGADASTLTYQAFMQGEVK
jgi:hypothetical protein